MNKIYLILAMVVCMTTSMCSQTLYDYVDYADKLPVCAHDNGLMDFLASNIKYPNGAIEDSIQGKVIISFKVDTLCNTSSFEVIKSLRNDLDSEAMRVVKKLKFIEPAFLNGKKVNYKYYLPIFFELPKI